MAKLRRAYNPVSMRLLHLDTYETQRTLRCLASSIIDMPVERTSPYNRLFPASCALFFSPRDKHLVPSAESDTYLNDELNVNVHNHSSAYKASTHAQTGFHMPASAHQPTSCALAMEKRFFHLQGSKPGAASTLTYTQKKLMIREITQTNIRPLRQTVHS